MTASKVQSFTITKGDIKIYRRNPLHYLLKSCQLGDVVKMKGLRGQFYLLNNPELIREVLVTKNDSFIKSIALQLARRGFVGEGLLTSEGETHKRHRRLIQPAFNPGHIVQYGGIMVEFAERLMDRWRDGEVRSIHQEMMQLTLSIITQTMFGMQVSEEANRIEEAVEANLRFLIHRVRQPLRSFLPSRSKRQAQEASALLDGIVYSILEKRRQAPTHKTEGSRDLLDMLLAARDEEDGSGLTDKEVRDQVATIFVAGHETTANALSWTWYLLAKHPDVEAKFWAELDAVLGGRTPTAEDVRRLKYTTCILNESMRMYPPAWTIGRQAAEDVQIGELQVKRGDTVLMSPYAMHHNPTYFPEPEAFRPERFEGDLLKQIPHYAYFPFGGGPRICIGNNFAILEAVLILATIGQKYRLRLANEQPVEMEPLITLRIKDELLMKVEAR